MLFKVFSIFFIVISVSYAKTYPLKDERGSGTINLNEKWTYLTEVFGFPFLFLSPGKKPNSSIGVTFTGIKNAKINPKSLKNSQDKFQASRQKWAKKSDVEITKFVDYKYFVNSQKVPVHSIGFYYIQNNKNFLQMSYYMECPKNFVHLKSLIYDKHTALASDATQAVKSFKCK